jgi:hypothetical protein
MIRKHPLVFFLFFTFCFLLFNSCKKESFITSSNATIAITDTLLQFDTVFTSVGNITQEFTINNTNNQNLLLTQVKLMGGSNSAFKININGMPGPEADNVTIEAGDSIHIFVTVYVNPTSANLPFVLNDSILINYNGNSKFVKLQAYGQNAHFLNGTIIKTNTTWPDDLPYVIMDSLQVDTAATLTIQQGCRIYLHANAPFLVDGTLIINGTKQDSVLFTGDRLDTGYNILPASWPGIYFRNTSINNILTHTVIRNSNQAIIISNPSTNSNPKLTLHRCIITNSAGAGILAYNTSVNVDNSLISNCGSNIRIEYGGTYNFINCTVASYGNLNVTHKNPVLQINNYDTASNATNALNAIFQNCIFWGNYGNVVDEVVVSQQGSNPFNVSFDHSLYKAIDEPTNSTFISTIENTDPGFDSINVSQFGENLSIYNFHLDSTSVCIDAGSATTFPLDLDDNPRTVGANPDMGCYEKQ